MAIQQKSLFLEYISNNGFMADIVYLYWHVGILLPWLLGVATVITSRLIKNS